MESSDFIKYIKSCRTYLKRNPSKVRASLLVLASLIGTLVISISVTGYINLATALPQIAFNYQIEAPDTVEFDCNMRYDDSKHVFLCDSKNYFGKVAMTPKSSLSIGGEWHTVGSSGAFERYVPELVVPASAWAVAEPHFEEELAKLNYYYDTIRIRNDYLHSVVLEKNVIIKWNFSAADIALMKNQWQAWKTEQETLAKDRLAAEIKAAEEAARKKAEEEERKRIEEEEKKRAEEEATRAEEARRAEEAARAATPSTEYYSPEPYSAPVVEVPASTPSSSGGGYAESDTDVEGVCKDGLRVRGNPHARGKANVCYGHGGWVK
ncbi:hypothetical protein IJG29_01855 [Candidatus Saccharibacteria bacterium]|nr:hypothetical protein [Candidatus Saccharibacteria bacterium]